MSSNSRKSKPWHVDDDIKFAPRVSDIPNVVKSKSASPIIRPSLSTGDSPLIPTSYLEVGNQRLLVISIFVVLQSYKLFDAVALTKGSEAFFFKFLLLDGLFILILPLLRVPWLTFNTILTFILFFCLVVFNLILSNNSFSLTGIFLIIWKFFFDSEVTFSGKKVHQHDQVYDPKSHLLGKYTVNILPESTALLNPSGITEYCVDAEKGYLPISIPIRLNATDPIFIQLSRIDFISLEESTLNFTKKELRGFKMANPGAGDDGSESSSENKSSKLSYLSLPVNKPGLYRLKKVTDSSQLDVRIYRSDVLVASCPSAHIVGEDDSNQERCIGDIDKAKLYVDGVPPLRVKYSRSTKGRVSEYSVESVQPDHYTSPLLSGTNTPFIWTKGSSLDWAKAKTIDVDLDSTASTTGPWIYEIDQVEDGLGNVIDYSKLLQTNALSSSRGLSYGFNVHPRPQIRFQGCDSVHPVKLPKGYQIELPVSLSGDDSDGPFEAVLERLPLDDDKTSNSTLFTHNFKSFSDRIIISEPGIYSLQNIKGKYCPGDVVEPSSCLVYVPPEPTIEIKFDDIEDKCAGATGFKADISITGNPPFSISYRIIKDNKVIATKTHDLSKSRDQLIFNPSEEGNYTYEFYSLSDGLYKGIILDGEEFVKQQSIHVLAGATFSERFIQPKRCCSGDSLKLKVKLNGIPPLELDYEIVNENGHKQQYTISNISTTDYEIETPALIKGGRYTISLVSVSDNRGCITTLNEKDIVAEVRRQRPKASFLPVDGSMNIKTLEGNTVLLPLRLSGEAPFSVTYKHIDESGENTYSVTAKDGDSLSVNKKGTYILSSISDAYCPGDINERNIIDITWVEKPTFSVITTPLLEFKTGDLYSRKEVCELEEDSFEISLEGTPPFVIYYDVEGPRNQVNQEIQVATKYATLKMDTTKPGLYKYKIKGVSDGIYDLSNLNFNKNEAVIVEQTVHKRPTVSFANRGRVYKTCINSYSEIEEIPINLSGQGPFSLTVELHHESTGKISKMTIGDINDSTYKLTKVYDNLSLGRYSVSFYELIDSKGCSRRDFWSEEKVQIVVADVPKITPINPKENYCIGERIGFSLDGVPPFEIVYEFNGKKHKATGDSPFSRLASSDGNLTFISLSDSVSNCKSRLDYMDSVIIRPIPSVSIEEEISRQDIHEGDKARLVFTFEGTPPFSFTYTRSEMVGRKLTVVESHSIENVNSNEHIIYTSTQGTYEVVALEDKYCSVSNR